MNRDDQQLTDRLRSAFEIEMTDETRDRQLSAISVALMEPPVAAPVAVPIVGRMRNRLAALVVAATVVTPAAVAVAAESSLPGELLYPVKQVTEDVRSVVDSTVVARHRLDEADAMLTRGYPIDEVDIVLVEADIAIMDAGDQPELRSRWTEMQDHMVTDSGDADRGGVPHDEYVPPRDGTDEMRDGTGGPMTDEMPSRDGTSHDRSQGTHDTEDSNMGSDTGTDRDTNPNMGSDMGTNDAGTGTVDDHGDTMTDEMPGNTGTGTMTDEMPGDTGTGTMTDEMSGDTGSGTPAEGTGDTWSGEGGSGMDEGGGTWSGTGHDGNG